MSFLFALFHSKSLKALLAIVSEEYKHVYIFGQEAAAFLCDDVSRCGKHSLGGNGCLWHSEVLLGDGAETGECLLIEFPPRDGIRV